MMSLLLLYKIIYVIYNESNKHATQNSALLNVTYQSHAKRNNFEDKEFFIDINQRDHIFIKITNIY